MMNIVLVKKKKKKKKNAVRSIVASVYFFTQYSSTFWLHSSEMAFRILIIHTRVWNWTHICTMQVLCQVTMSLHIFDNNNIIPTTDLIYVLCKQFSSPGAKYTP
jgi:hypothetical protein